MWNKFTDEYPEQNTIILLSDGENVYRGKWFKELYIEDDRIPLPKDKPKYEAVWYILEKGPSWIHRMPLQDAPFIYWYPLPVYPS